MNTAIQCLSHTIPLTDFFVGSSIWRKDLNTENCLGTGGKLAIQFAKLVEQMWNSNNGAVTPKSFKIIVSDFAPQFSGYAQHDCQELLVFLLDGLHEDLNRVANKPYVEVQDSNGRKDEVVAAEMWLNHLMRNKSVIVDLFQGQLKSALTCGMCSYESVTFDPFMYLSLPFPSENENSEDIEVESLLDQFLIPECLEGDEQWYCPKCKEHVNATKKLDLWKLPPVLIIHLKRFKYDRLGIRQQKISNMVNSPLSNFSLEKYTKSEQREPPQYDLYAVARHMGSTGGGHYTAVAKHRLENQWYEFNDSHCNAMSSNDVLDNNAYLLFYQKQNLKDSGYRRQSVSNPRNWPHTLHKDELEQLNKEIQK